MQFDLFDQKDAKGAGDRQLDLEEIVAYEDIVAQEDSLLAMIRADDQAGIDDWNARAKAGEVMRIC